MQVLRQHNHPLPVWHNYAMIARRISPAFLGGANKRADMKTVYFVRHGSTEGNEQGAYQHLYTPLSELGRRQAAFVARRFERIPVDIVIASDMERAAETGRSLPKGTDCLLSLTRCFKKFFALPSYVAKGGRRLKRWR